MAYTRANIANITYRALGTLAADAGLSMTATEDLSEGDFTDAIDAGMRAIGAIDADTGDLDASLITNSNVDNLLLFVRRAMLERLQLHYATVTDISIGQREEKLSQIGQALARLLGGAGNTGAGGQVIARPLRREADDYELGA